MTRQPSVDLKGSPDRFGYECSVSLAELTEACAERAGRRVDITSQPDTNPVDIPYYVTDNSAVTTATGWRPRLSMSDILDDISGGCANTAESSKPY